MQKVLESDTTHNQKPHMRLPQDHPMVEVPKSDVLTDDLHRNSAMSLPECRNRALRPVYLVMDSRPVPSSHVLLAINLNRGKMHSKLASRRVVHPRFEMLT